MRYHNKKSDRFGGNWYISDRINQNQLNKMIKAYLIINLLFRMLKNTQWMVKSELIFLIIFLNRVFINDFVITIK